MKNGYVINRGSRYPGMTLKCKRRWQSWQRGRILGWHVTNDRGSEIGKTVPILQAEGETCHVDPLLESMPQVLP